MFTNKEEFKKVFSTRVIEKYGRDVSQCHITECYDILGTMVRDSANVNLKSCKDEITQKGKKQLIYFSMEFLIGRLLESNLMNLGIYEVVKEGLNDFGINIHDLEEQETDAGLGNGGLGRLAACFLDSIASISLPGHGNCIRYEYGFFKQRIKQGKQIEVPDQWLLSGNVWEIRKPKHSVEVKFYGQAETYQRSDGAVKSRTVNAVSVTAIPYDVPVIGYNNNVTNTLRLWSAEPSDASIPSSEDFNSYLSFVKELCHGLYPDDSTEHGRILRLRQQYFLVSSGLQSMIRMHLRNNTSLDNLADHFVVQLNDTHPILAIPELLRLLMDENDYGWEKAWTIATKLFAFTNHTVMAEALEKWPVNYVANLIPRVFMIIEEINRRFILELREQGRDENLINNVSIIKDGMINMCSLAIRTCFSVNGVAALHTAILTSQTFRYFFQLYPHKFNNKTNGITHRRWFLYANPALSNLVRSKIGDEWITSPSKLVDFIVYKNDSDVITAMEKIKKDNKAELIKMMLKENNIKIDIDSIFDIQVKRLHAYKRQLMNIFRVIYFYQKMKTDPTFRIHPHTYIFGAKAAPSYAYAKKIIELIIAVGKRVNNDPEFSKYIKVVFIENYGVSKAEIIIPAADVSEQISTAGKEASGTSNMKFMINGALTLGTLDGANIEIHDLVTSDNDKIFGLKEDEIAKIKYEGSYNPWDIYNTDSEIRNVLDSLVDASFGEKDYFKVIFDEIMYRGDEYFILKDIRAYINASLEIDALYLDKKKWGEMMVTNVAKAGYFSSDRTINQYNDEIWHLEKMK